MFYPLHVALSWTVTRPRKNFESRLDETIRAYELGEASALGQLRRWLDDADSPPAVILSEARRLLDFAQRVHEAPDDLAEFTQQLDSVIARMDRLPKDVL